MSEARDRILAALPPVESDEKRAGAVELHVETLRAKLLSAAQLDRLPRPVPLIGDLLVRNTLAALVGKPGVGKSFVAEDMGNGVATRTWFHGHPVTQGLVVYIAAEGAAGLPQRKQAWEQANRVVIGENQKLWLPMAVNLLDSEWSDALVQLIAELGPILVVIDTVARSMVGGDENASKDMGRLVDNADRIRQAAGATVLLVHHTPKDGETLRGHSSLEGALDTVIEVKADGPNITLRCAKQKDVAKFSDVRLHLRPIGDSAAIYSQNSLQRPEELTSGEVALLGAMRESCGTNGLAPSVLRAITEQPSSTFYRSLKALQDRGLVLNLGTDKRPLYTPKGESDDGHS